MELSQMLMGMIAFILQSYAKKREKNATLLLQPQTGGLYLTAP
jgi:hypothetical protein